MTSNATLQDVKNAKQINLIDNPRGTTYTLTKYHEALGRLLVLI